MDWDYKFHEKVLEKLAESLEVQRESLSELRAIRKLLQEERNPTGFRITETAIKGEAVIMDTKKATGHSVGLEILPDGRVRFTFTPTPAGSTLPAGTPPLSYTSSDPALAVAVDPADTSGFGLVAIGTPNLPAGSSGVTGIVVTGQTTLPGASAPIVSDPATVDIVPAPNLPTGFSVQESAA